MGRESGRRANPSPAARQKCVFVARRVVCKKSSHKNPPIVKPHSGSTSRGAHGAFVDRLDLRPLALAPEHTHHAEGHQRDRFPACGRQWRGGGTGRRVCAVQPWRCHGRACRAVRCVSSRGARPAQQRSHASTGGRAPGAAAAHTSGQPSVVAVRRCRWGESMGCGAAACATAPPAPPDCRTPAQFLPVPAPPKQSHLPSHTNGAWATHALHPSPCNAPQAQAAAAAGPSCPPPPALPPPHALQVATPSL